MWYLSSKPFSWWMKSYEVTMQMKNLQQYFYMYLWLFTSLCCANLFWHLSLWMKTYGFTIQMKPLQRYFHWAGTRDRPWSCWGKRAIHVIGCQKISDGKGKRAAELGACLWCWQWYHALIGQISQMFWLLGFHSSISANMGKDFELLFSRWKCFARE